MCCYSIARVFLRLSANNELLYIWMEGEPSLARDRPRRDLGAALRERDQEQDEHGFLEVLLAL